VLWLIDGHHHAKALFELQTSDPAFSDFSGYVDLREDWSDLSRKDFEKAMQRGKKGVPFVYLSDEKGNPVTFAELPSSVEKLKDYPLRTLVWLLKKSGAVKKLDVYPFQEFVIARRLAAKVTLSSPLTDRSYLRALRYTLELLEDADPEDYPGLENYSASAIDSMYQKAKLLLD
jgi:hypothetical protein